MATFIEPPVEYVKYKNAAGPYQNSIVNLDMCKRIVKRTEVLQYDAKLPSLVFVGCETTWVFLTEEERDEALDDILNLTRNGSRTTK